MASPFFHTAFRRYIDTLRLGRLPRSPPKRFQSSGPTPGPGSNPPGSGASKSAKPVEPIPVPNTVAPPNFWQRLGPLTRAGEAYARTQRKRPYATQVGATLVVYLAGDVCAQRISGKDYDPLRTLRSLAIGGFAAIPNWHWFLFLSNSFNYSSKVLSIFTKVSVNQICFTPIFNSYFFGMQSLLSGDSPAEAVERIKKTVPVSMLNSLKLWPAVTAFSFAFIPLEFRSVFAGVIAVGWQTYLSFLNRTAEAEQAAAKVLAATMPVPPASQQQELPSTGVPSLQKISVA